MGMDECVRKPVKRDVLVGLMEGVVKRRCGERCKPGYLRLSLTVPFETNTPRPFISLPDPPFTPRQQFQGVMMPSKGTGFLAWKLQIAENHGIVMEVDFTC